MCAEWATAIGFPLLIFAGLAGFALIIKAAGSGK